MRVTSDFQTTLIIFLVSAVGNAAPRITIVEVEGVQYITVMSVCFVLLLMTIMQHAD